MPNASLFPQAVAMRHTGGLAIGVDPWTAAEVEQKDNLDRIVPLVGEGLAKRLDYEAPGAGTRPEWAMLEKP